MSPMDDALNLCKAFFHECLKAKDNALHNALLTRCRIEAMDPESLNPTKVDYQQQLQFMVRCVVKGHVTFLVLRRRKLGFIMMNRRTRSSRQCLFI